VVVVHGGTDIGGSILLDRPERFVIRRINDGGAVVAPSNTRSPKVLQIDVLTGLEH
jgi:hypothetical protein